MFFVKTFIFLLFFSFTRTEDYYDMLGVSKDADNRDIRRAFKKLALKMHPDKNPNDKEAHEQFIKINNAYEVLKDEEMRKKYDLYGEAGLDDGFGKSWKGNYQSWNYYYESFGIYDDDPEIITLSRSDFELSVLGSPDVWFINFYSPQCSHCHHLAPAWRSMARELEGVIRIGAVNCEEDWVLCRQQNIHSYPSLIMYPEKEKYQGSRETEDMVSYVMRHLQNKVIDLSKKNLKDILSSEEYNNKPWLISVCKNRDECISSDVLKKLGIILDGLVNVAKADIRRNQKICGEIACDSMITFYENLTVLSETEKGYAIDETETKSILNEVLKLLPGPEELSVSKFEEIQQELHTSSSQPWLVEFTKESSSDTNKDTELKRLRAFLPGVHLGYIDCQKYSALCSSFSVRKFPMFIIFKQRGAYEFHHGRFTAHDIATFARESLSSHVETLSPKDFPAIVQSHEPWFIDFFAPWCPPCMQLLPEWRKASRNVGHLVRFGTVDCTMYATLCNKYNIRSYPTTILYNQSVPHQFHGSHSQQHLQEFVQDTLNPSVIPLTRETFRQLVKNKSKEDMWAVDFFAPWCGPCQQLGPQWRKLAKMLNHDSSIHVGQVDCTAFPELCKEQGVNSYPTIRLYPKGSIGISKFHFYNGWNRDANSLQAWIYNFLPSKVHSFDTDDFSKMLADSEPWVIDFYAPWCGHCQIFAPEFENIAQTLDGKVKAGKVNCENLPHLCHKAGVRAYPTVLFYGGSKKNVPQSTYGEEIHNLNHYGVLSFIENKLEIRLKHSRHDEL